MRFIKSSLIALVMGMSISSLSHGDEAKEGFFDGSSISVLTRNMYFNRDYRKQSQNNAGTNQFKDVSQRKGYREEWAQGILAKWESGYTQGTVGFGLDAYTMIGIRLDGGGGRTGGGLLPVDDSGHPERNSMEAGGAVKFKVSNTVIKYGNMFVETPVFDTGDSRLLPEVATGLFIQSNEIKDLTLTAGHFTALNDQAQTGRDSVYDSGHTLKSANIIGANYKFTDNLSGALFASDVKDFWKKKYANLGYVYVINENNALNFDFNIYKTTDEGKSYAGDIDSTLWSFGTGYAFGAHKVTLTRQVASGKGPGAPYSVDGGDTIYVGNSVQYSDFNHEDEQSWQLRYDLNMLTYGIPGLSFMTRYVTSDNIKIADSNDGKAWERNIEAKYVVQSGPAKNLSFRIRQATYRSHQLDENIDEVRMFVEYPINIM